MKRIHKEDEHINDKLLIASVILATLVIGLFWELWELFVGLSDVIKDQFDSFLDLVMDTAGAISAVLYYYWFKK